MSVCYVKPIPHLENYYFVQNLIAPLLEYPRGSYTPIRTLNPFVRILEIWSSLNSVHACLLDYRLSGKPNLTYAEYSKLPPTDLQKIETIHYSIPIPIITFLNSHSSFIGFDLLGNWFIEIIVTENQDSTRYATPSFSRVRELLDWMVHNIDKMKEDLSSISKALKKAVEKPKSKSNVKYKSTSKVSKTS